MENIRVVVLRDFSYTERPGEEELAIERFLSAAPFHIAISVQPPSKILTKGFIENPDVLISFGLKKYPSEVLDWVLTHPRHIHVEQDWWEPTQPNHEYRNRIAEQAAALVFLSPMHMERYLRIYNVEPKVALCAMFPLLETDFSDASLVPTEEEVLWHAPWHPDYGNDLMLSWAKRTGQKVSASGLETPIGEITQNVIGIGNIALDAAAPVMRKYSKFIYFPRKPIPFGFASFLAYMYGLEITYSGEIGWQSWNESALVSLGLQAASLFWDSVSVVAA